MPIRIVTPSFGHLSKQDAEQYKVNQPLPYYFFLFVLEGSARHRIDMKHFEIGKHELLFCTPYQVQEFPHASHGSDYYKLGFDEHCLSRLPKQYPFLLNPLTRQKMLISPKAAVRLENIFKILLELLQTADNDPELILAYLNSFLTEINTVYFTSVEMPRQERLSTFIDFKIFVEDNLTGHPSVTKIAEELAVSTDTLYRIVKQHSGCSPKEFINERLILEARRRLYYGQPTSVKELAYELGFNDPDYFSRLFKKVAGKTIATFFKDLS